MEAGETDRQPAAACLVEAERDLHDAIASSTVVARAVPEVGALVVGKARADAFSRHDRCLIVAALKTRDDLRADPGFQRAVAAGDRLAAAWTAVFRENLTLGGAVARRYAGRGLDLPDLIQEGSIGLMKSIDRFDPRRNAKLATYAVWWIRQAMGSALSYQGRTIRIPPHVTSTVHKIASARHDLMGRMGRQPATGEIAAHLDVSVERV